MGTQIYAAHTRRSSLGWLALALTLGGAPLVVYFTQPDAPATNAVLAATLGLPCFSMSLRELLVRRAIVVDRDGGRVLHGVVFLRLRVRELRFEEVEGVGEDRGVVRLWPRRRALIHLERDDAAEVARAISESVGVPYRGADTSFDDSSSTNAPMRRYLS